MFFGLHAISKCAVNINKESVEMIPSAYMKVLTKPKQKQTL